MKKILALCLSLVAASPIFAADSITSTSNIVTLANIDMSYYSYDPKPDITAPELSEVFKLVLPAITCRNIMGCDIKEAIKAAPENVKRHFVYHER